MCEKWVAVALANGAVCYSCLAVLLSCVRRFCGVLGLVRVENGLVAGQITSIQSLLSALCLVMPAGNNNNTIIMIMNQRIRRDARGSE